MKDKTCNRCKAYRYACGTATCQLGYVINQKTGAPKEPCPKPLTYLALMECLEDRKLEKQKRA